MEPEFFLALAGITLASLALVALSEYRRAQQARHRREAFEEHQLDLLDEPDLPDLSARELPFFVVRHTYNPDRYFRVYSDLSALLFLDIVNKLFCIDAQSIRKPKSSGWWTRDDGSIQPVLLGVYLVITLLLCWSIFTDVRAGYANADAFEPSRIVMKIIGLMVLLGIGALPVILWKTRQRIHHLDGLQLTELREEAATRAGSILATSESVSEIQMTIHEIESVRNFACIRFQHTPTGRWKFVTETLEDTKAAVAMFLRVFGEDAVVLDETLQRKQARWKKEQAEDE